MTAPTSATAANPHMNAPGMAIEAAMTSHPSTGTNQVQCGLVLLNTTPNVSCRRPRPGQPHQALGRTSASVIQGMSVPAKAKVKNTAVSRTEANRVETSGGVHHACRRSRLKTVTSSSSAHRNAVRAPGEPVAERILDQDVRAQHDQDHRSGKCDGQLDVRHDCPLRISENGFGKRLWGCAVEVASTPRITIPNRAAGRIIAPAPVHRNTPTFEGVRSCVVWRYSPRCC